MYSQLWSLNNQCLKKKKGKFRDHGSQSFEEPVKNIHRTLQILTQEARVRIPRWIYFFKKVPSSNSEDQPNLRTTVLIQFSSHFEDKSSKAKRKEVNYLISQNWLVTARN